MKISKKEALGLLHVLTHYKTLKRNVLDDVPSLFEFTDKLEEYVLSSGSEEFPTKWNACHSEEVEEVSLEKIVVDDVINNFLSREEVANLSVFSSIEGDDYSFWNNEQECELKLCKNGVPQAGSVYSIKRTSVSSLLADLITIKFNDLVCLTIECTPFTNEYYDCFTLNVEYAIT